MLYTDGLIETRSSRSTRAWTGCVAAAETVEPDLEVFASRLLAEVGPQPAVDDIAMVVIRRAAS